MLRSDLFVDFRSFSTFNLLFSCEQNSCMEGLNAKYCPVICSSVYFSEMSFPFVVAFVSPSLAGIPWTNPLVTFLSTNIYYTDIVTFFT